MKTLIFALLVFPILSFVRAGESVTLFAPPGNGDSGTTITLAQGDAAELTYAPIPELTTSGAAYDTPDYNIVFTADGKTLTYKPWLAPPFRTVNKTGSTQTEVAYTESARMNPVKFAGPGTIKLTSVLTVATPRKIATFSIVRAASAANGTPSNAVVIPNDPGTTFQVILESSSDMITWTPATPGAYSSATVKRFFRTRIVKLP